MTIYIAVVNTEGDAESIWTTGVIPDIAEGAAPWDSTRTIVHLNGDLEDTGVYIANNYYKEGSWHTREGRPSDHHIWKDEAWELNSTSFWVEVRILRDNLLTASDWTQIADNNLTDTEKAEWVEYRQALRGVPSVNAEVVHLDLVVWPDAP